MRRLCLTVAISAMLVLPAWAQQAEDSTRDAAKTAAASTAASTAETTNAVPAASRSSFAIPDVPRATPFPGPAASASSDEDGPGLLVPKFELAAMYSYINFQPGSGFPNFNSEGGTGSFTYNANKWLGLTAEAGAYGFSRSVPGVGKPEGGFQTYLFGPRLNLRRKYFVPFIEFLIGDFRADGQVTGGARQSSFALAAGGGVDVVFTKHIAWRFAQLDYLQTNANGIYLNPNGRQDNFRAANGLGDSLRLPATGATTAIRTTDGFMLGKSGGGVSGLERSLRNSCDRHQSGESTAELQLHSDGWHGGRHRAGRALEFVGLGGGHVHGDREG